MYAPVSLTKDEENAMQYACGYIPYKLLCKYEKKSDLVSVQYVKCSCNMAVAGPEDECFFNILVGKLVLLPKFPRTGFYGFECTGNSQGSKAQ